MLKAKLPRSDKARNPIQFGDLSLEMASRKHSNGRMINASTIKTIAYRLPKASLTSSGLKITE